MLETLTTSSGRDPSHAAPRTEGLGLPHPAWRGTGRPVRPRDLSPRPRGSRGPSRGYFQGFLAPVPGAATEGRAGGFRRLHRRPPQHRVTAADASPGAETGLVAQPAGGVSSSSGPPRPRPPPPLRPYIIPPRRARGHLESGTGEPPGSGPDALRQRWLRAQRLLHYQQLPETPGDGPALTGGALGGPPRNRGPCGGWGDLPMTSRRTNSSENEGRVGAGTERTEAESPVGSPGGREDL